MLLDDPIQNMDDFNVLGLLDALRSAKAGRQVVVSTHDAQLAELVRRKLRPTGFSERTIVHRFRGYGPEGPHVDTEVETFIPAPELIESLSSGTG
jgi:hypothetical protein